MLLLRTVDPGRFPIRHLCKGVFLTSYFAPYIDASGLHMPTYEDRLSALVGSYRSIFGLDAELSEAVPDYQLLSVIARSLDDASQLALSVFNSRNPLYAQGQALDLLLPLYGLRRLPGETDAKARSRILSALSSNGNTMVENLLAEILKVPDVRQAQVHVNDSNATDEKGIPAHSIGCVVEAGRKADIAAAIFRKKAPGIGTSGTTSVSVMDANGASHTIRFSRPAESAVNIYLDITAYDGYDSSTTDMIRQAVADCLNNFRIGQSLVVPQLYGISYAAAGKEAATFAITDIRAASPLITGTTRELVPANWNTKLYTSNPERIIVTVTPAA